MGLARPSAFGPRISDFLRISGFGFRISSAILLLAMCATPSASAATNTVRLLTLDPGHFHAGLVQKFMYPQVDPVAHVYAPAGPDLQEHLKRIGAEADAITREIEARMWTWMTSSTGKSFVIGDCLDPESAFYAECATPVLSLCYAFVEALSHE